MINQVQTNIGILMSVMCGARMLMIVTMMLIAPMIDDRPMRWIEKIRNGNASPVCSTSGGYMVQPLAGAPPGKNNVESSMPNATGSIQNDQLFMRGNAMSGAPICSGIIQFARPTNAGITAPNTMISACMVVMELKNSGCTNCRPGMASSERMTSAIMPPMKNIERLKIRYIVPMSLWLVANNQRR